MSKPPSPEQWQSFFQDRGIPKEIITEYKSYITRISENNVPVIFELEHLSKLIGIEYTILCKMVNCPERFYRKFSIAKRSGGRRELSAPYPSLLHCQKWIYKNILLQFKAHHCANGFIRGKSIITNASPHLDKKSLLKMDMEDFFPSIPINWVINYFHKLGYAENVSFYLSALCCHNNALPQGAPTSPHLSNLLLHNFDSRIKKLCDAYHINYTRYADDLTFSSGYIPHSFPNIVASIVADYGLRINESKTRLHTKNGQRIVTGISVSGKTPKIPRKMKRDIRKEIHFIDKYGFLSHASKLRINDPNYLSSLEGRINFWIQVEPETKCAKEFLKILRSLKEVQDL